MALHRVETRVDDDLFAWLETTAKREGRSLANLLLRFVEEARIDDIKRRRETRGKRGGK